MHCIHGARIINSIGYITSLEAHSCARGHHYSLTSVNVIHDRICHLWRLYEVGSRPHNSTTNERRRPAFNVVTLCRFSLGNRTPSPQPRGGQTMSVLHPDSVLRETLRYRRLIRLKCGSKRASLSCQLAFIASSGNGCSLHVTEVATRVHRRVAQKYRKCKKRATITVLGVCHSASRTIHVQLDRAQCYRPANKQPPALSIRCLKSDRGNMLQRFRVAWCAVRREWLCARRGL